MKSRHSTSLLLAWRVAEAEARNLNGNAIEPTHLLLGLCKMVDLDLPEVISKDAPDRDDILEECLREIRKIRTVFQVAGVNPKILRRRLRRASPDRRFSLEESERLHRNSSAKQVFADAEHFARASNAAVYPVHLLYATLLAEDDDRDAILADFKMDKKRLLSVAKREVLTFQIGSASGTRAARARWN